jgi:hypothetical protein
MAARKTSKRNVARLRSWVNFVKKVQKDEKVSYKEAMTLASKRKSQWKHRGGEGESVSDEGNAGSSPSLSDIEWGDDDVAEGSAMEGGKRRRRRGSSKRRTRRNKTKKRR